jgi:hypothetical protein
MRKNPGEPELLTIPIVSVEPGETILPRFAPPSLGLSKRLPPGRKNFPPSKADEDMRGSHKWSRPGPRVIVSQARRRIFLPQFSCTRARLLLFFAVFALSAALRGQTDL